MGKTANGDLPFGFTPVWYALGIVDDAVMVRLNAEWAKGEDDNAEHYRYRAFREFFGRQVPLTPKLAIALWELAEDDMDLCWVIRTSIVQRAECPDAVEQAALASGRTYLKRIIESRHSSKKPDAE